MKPIQASELNQRIRIRHKKPAARDELGGVLPAEWFPAEEIWAHVQYKPVVRKEMMGENVNYVPVCFVIREKDIKNTDQIQFDDEIYEILNIVKMEGIPKLLEIQARTIRGI